MCQTVKAASRRTIEYRSIESCNCGLVSLCPPALSLHVSFWVSGPLQLTLSPQSNLITTVRMAKEGLCRYDKVSRALFFIHQVERKKGGLDVPRLLANRWNWIFK